MVLAELSRRGFDPQFLTIEPQIEDTCTRYFYFDDNNNKIRYAVLIDPTRGPELHAWDYANRSDVVVAGEEYTTTVESGELIYVSEGGSANLGRGVSISVRWIACDAQSLDQTGMLDVSTRLANRVIAGTVKDALRRAAANFDSEESFQSGFDPELDLKESASPNLIRFGICVLRYSFVGADTGAHN